MLDAHDAVVARAVPVIGDDGVLVLVEGGRPLEGVPRAGVGEEGRNVVAPAGLLGSGEQYVVVVALLEQQFQLVTVGDGVVLKSVGGGELAYAQIPEEINVLPVKRGIHRELKVHHDVIPACVVLLPVIADLEAAVDVGHIAEGLVHPWLQRLHHEPPMLAVVIDGGHALGRKPQPLQIDETVGHPAGKPIDFAVVVDDLGVFYENGLQGADGVVPAAILKDDGLQPARPGFRHGVVHDAHGVVDLYMGTAQAHRGRRSHLDGDRAQRLIDHEAPREHHLLGLAGLEHLHEVIAAAGDFEGRVGEDDAVVVVALPGVEAGLNVIDGEFAEAPQVVGGHHVGGGEPVEGAMLDPEPVVFEGGVEVVEAQFQLPTLQRDEGQTHRHSHRMQGHAVQARGRVAHRHLAPPGLLGHCREHDAQQHDQPVAARPTLAGCPLVPLALSNMPEMRRDGNLHAKFVLTDCFPALPLCPEK